MALTAEPTGHLEKAWTGTRDHATDSIALLSARAAYGKEGKMGTIQSASTERWRIDRQKNPASKSNLQVQRNGADSPSTVACLIVPNKYFFELDGPDSSNRDAELTRVIRQGLSASLTSWAQTTESGPWGKRAAVVKEFEIRGEFSSPRPEFVSPQKPVK
jgi:hypothetical protein